MQQNLGKQKVIKERLNIYLGQFYSLNRWGKAAVLSLIFILLICFSLLALRMFVGWGFFGGIPSTKELSSVAKPLASELYDRQGQLLGRYYIENRSHMELEDLNDFYRQALIATEDRRFFDHDGVDTRSLFRVFFKSLLLQKDASGGGSTITQQLAKNLYPRKSYKILSTLINKFREMEIAERLEDIYEKEEILLLYSNTVSFGERAFGLHTAAKRFFNKEPQQLLLEEAATLVGMLKATSYYSPRKYPERARNRRNVVLSQMHKYDYITAAVKEQLSALPLILDYQPPSDSQELARYFKEKVKKDFNTWSMSMSKPDGSKYDLYKDGLKVYSTLDLNMQEKAEKIMQFHLSRVQKIFEKSWEGGRILGPGTKLIDEKITTHPYYKSLRASGKNGKEALAEFTKMEEFRFWTWNGYLEKNTTKIDSIKHYLKLLHGSMLAVKPATGEVLTWIGGNDYGHFQWDDVAGPRQVGSTFKPVVYLTALEKGVQPCDEFKNELVTYEEYDNWTPKNSGGGYGNIATMKGALTHSINTISVKLLFEVGIPSIVRMAERLGITTPLAKVPSMVLGTSDISLLDMVQVYSVFANRGVKKDLTTILKIEDSQGLVLYENEALKDNNGERVVVEEIVDQLNEMLLNASVKGTGRRIYANYDIKFPVMGKTGTTQNQSDGWYIGYNDDLVIGAWVGTHDRRVHFRTLVTGSGGRTALPLVASLFEYAGQHNYITNRKARISEIMECPDTLTSKSSLLALKENIENQIETLSKEIMGRYYKITKSGSDRNKRRKRDKERDKLYREYKKEVQELEEKLRELDRQLRNDTD